MELFSYPRYSLLFFLRTSLLASSVMSVMLRRVEGAVVIHESTAQVAACCNQHIVCAPRRHGYLTHVVQSLFVIHLLYTSFTDPANNNLNRTDVRPGTDQRASVASCSLVD